MAIQLIATNKKAYRNFALTDKFECGIALEGAEVKSIRAGDVNFKDSFARIDKGEVHLHSLYIGPYAQASISPPDPDRVRKLLLHKKEIKKLTAKINQDRLALVPTRIYFNSRGLVKLEIALGKGKKLFDKREDIKKRSINKALQRTLKNHAR